MSVVQGALPRWDLSSVFPSPDSPEFTRAAEEIAELTARLEALFDRGGIGGEAAGDGGAAVELFEAAVEGLNALAERARHAQTYLALLVAVDSGNDRAQARLSELQAHGVRIAQLDKRWSAWLRTLDLDALIERSAVARDHAYVIRREARLAAHLMSPAEEALASELSLSGGTAWAKLHGNLTSQIQVDLELDGERRRLPMSDVRNLADHPDRDVRRRAYEAELAAWAANALPLAAALNGVKGEAITLNARRRWHDPIEPALEDNRIDRATLEAMHAAVREALPAFRRYMRAKARALGQPTLPWYDMFAPVGGSGRAWAWQEATGFIVEQFATFGEGLAGLARRAFAEGWVDAEPRFGKRDGAFCSRLGEGDSRVMMNWLPAFDGVSTLAHELGHAYHNLCQAGRTPMQRQNPMTLAETASTFCEALVDRAYMPRLEGPERVAHLEQRLRGLNQIVVDIHSRFLFESGLFERRRRRELSVDELRALMLEAQRETYGDGLDQAALHPYMWAVKSHYYSPRRSFYNFPYTFGALFGLGLFARYQREPAAFVLEYDALLASTGLADAATLAARFGIDIRSAGFWRSSLDVIRADIEEFVGLTTPQAASGAQPERPPAT